MSALLIAACATEQPPPPASPQGGVAVQQQPAQAEAQIEVAPDVTVEAEEVVATSEPPELVYEEAEPIPSEGMIWVGGYWAWTGVDWYWYGGRWSSAPIS